MTKEIQVAHSIRRELTRADMRVINLDKSLWYSKLDLVRDENIKGVIKSKLNGPSLGSMIKNGYGLMVSGKPAIGKSSVAALFAKEAMRWEYSVYCTSHNQLIELKSENKELEDGMTTMDRIKSAELLVVDDLNHLLISPTKAKSFDFFNPEDLERLLRSRSAGLKSTIITTQLDSKQWSTPALKECSQVIEKNIHSLIMINDPWVDEADKAKEEFWHNKR